MALHRLRPRTDQDLPEFMLHCLQYYSWTGRLIADTAETTIPHLSAERFRAMLFPFPTRSEQEEIVERIRKLDTSLARVRERHRQTADFVHRAVNGVGL